MCGIAGVVGEGRSPVLKKMIESMKSRGPDGYGEHIDPANDVGLAMCRLSIIDLALGQQPLSNEDGTVWVVCNGEIYNSPELRRDLQARGHQFKTHNSDVEVLVHLYEEKGANLLADLNGMFAFVIFDSKKKILFGARDRMGIKPFYYAHKQGKFAFSSELKSLLLLPWIKRDIHSQSLYHYLSLQYVPAPDSIFEDIKKLPAGHSFQFDLQTRTLKIQQYWELNVVQIENRPQAVWQELIREQLKQAILRWTLSDVPIACSLSGGLDSSSIVGFLAQSGMKDIRTYSLGFAESQAADMNELPLARKVAEKWGTKHHEVILTADRVLQDLDRMVWHLDEPYAGGLPSWYIYELIGKDVKVALTGTGGDELFGNYRKYRGLENNGAIRFLKVLKNGVKSGRLPEISDALSSPFGYFYPKYFSDAMKDQLLAHGHGFERTAGLIEKLARRSGTHNSRNRVGFVDFQTQLPEEFLAVTDRFSMAHSVEARVPFLDHELVENVYRMPPELRAMNGDPKGFLRETVKDVLPPELLTSPKRGFILPLKSWTRQQLRPALEELLNPEYLRQQGIFSSDVYTKVLKPHLSEQADHTQQVWTLFMFQKWYRRFIDG